jgi:hypothetical protein
MASYNSALKTWGANGSEYPDGYNYTAGDQPVDAWDNFLTSNLIGDISHLISVTNDRIESDSGGSGGEPASPEASHLYHDQNAERLNVWDASSSVWRNHLRRGGDTMAGVLDMGGYQIEDSTGTLTLAGNVNVSSTLSQGGSNVATESWVNSNADVANADYADSAGDANTLDGNDSSYFTTLTEVNNNADVPNADYADNAGDADTLDGNHASAFTSLSEVNNNADVPNADYADNAGQLDGNDSSYFTTLSEVNNNADVPNADYADSAGDADTLDGNDSSAFASTLTIGSYTSRYTNGNPTDYQNPTSNPIFVIVSMGGGGSVSVDNTTIYEQPNTSSDEEKADISFVVGADSFYRLDSGFDGVFSSHVYCELQT